MTFLRFREAEYAHAATEAERVAVDDATRILPSGYTPSTSERALPLLKRESFRSMA